MLLQRKKYASRLLKDEQMLLEVGDKCSFYIKEYNTLKDRIIKESQKDSKDKKYKGKTALIGDFFYHLLVIPKLFWKNWVLRLI